MPKRSPGLVQQNGIWHIKKMFRGRLICESCKTSSLEVAEQYLSKRLEEIRQAEMFGVRPQRTFREAATKYLHEKHKKSLEDDAYHLEALDPYIGDLEIDSIHSGSFLQFQKDCKKRGLKNKSINLAMGVARHILNLCASEWADSSGLTWLHRAPKLKMLPLDDQAVSYPLDWDEQEALFKELPPHLERMALFKVNTGCREQEVCGLKWSWLHHIPEINAYVFIVPGVKVKNTEDRLIVLNKVALSVIDSCKGNHKTWVFTRETGKKDHKKHAQVKSMNNTAWKRAWREAKLPVNNDFKRGVHNLKHTFGRRLRAAGVSYETRQVLLGHSNGDITTHYSAPEIQELIAAAEKVCTRRHGLTLLKVVS